jgi:tRNA threonylcarbamoyladenosine biosynthesis protein TsaB
MLVLAIDSALEACSCALAGPEIALARTEPMQRGHAERLAPTVQELTREAGVRMAELDRIAVTVGPGSFTGVRVGLSFARGLALALGKSCVGISTLEALAGDGAGVRAAAIQSADEVFFALYDGARAIVAPQRLGVAAAATLLTDGALIRGPAAHLLARDGVRLEVCGASDPLVLARLAAARDPQSAPPPPLYLRAPDAKLPAAP